ncbi:RDD family protein [Streptomyces iconiensis]|uniref:RDD family protein n=1 Tax=Streptomyces iconiensis TaxID=1384038 RepID=A0ABT7A8Z6_9ACTN|nr:RDD family protein [Streptomyces iconiensis]MDJ1137796.1 RDD family protein [Streptomyces iconiensis]
MSELVTGDAVVLGLRPARLPSRGLAVLIDLLLAWTVYLLLSLALLMATASLDAAALAAVQVGLFLLVLVGAPIAVETLSGGRSLGKLAAGLRVVREDGGPIRFRHALVRGAIGVVEIQLLFGVIACVASLVSERGRRLGDVFAGTLVVRERVPVPRGLSVPPPPPWLAGQLSEVDLSRVPDGLWLAVRQYLMRAGQLEPGVSRSMAERLAEDVRAWTGAPAPEGMTAAVYLAGVVAERQARDARRAFSGPPADLNGPAEIRPGTAAGEAGHGGWQAPAEAPSGGVPARGAVAPGTVEPADGGESGPPQRRTGFVPPT